MMQKRGAGAGVVPIVNFKNDNRNQIQSTHNTHNDRYQANYGHGQVHGQQAAQFSNQTINLNINNNYTVARDASHENH